MLPVEKVHDQLDVLVEAAGVDAPGIGVGARLVKALDPAFRAEQMLGRPRPEAIACQLLTAALQSEIAVWHDDVDEAGHPADRAIAVDRRHRRGAPSRRGPTPPSTSP